MDNSSSFYQDTSVTPGDPVIISITEALDAATNAVNSASNSASAAQASATSATNAATTATSAATSAQDSATSATSAATSAQASATSATSAATTASNAATAASSSATSAQASATSASASATSASASATAAQNSAIAAQSVAISGVTGFRNRLINGGMWVNQRGSLGQTVSASNTITYTVDRWFAYFTGTAPSMSVSQNITPTGPSTNLLKTVSIYGATGITKVGFGQRISYLDSYDLAGQTCTLSFLTSLTYGTVVKWEAYYANGMDTFGSYSSPNKTSISNGSVTVTSTLTQYSVQIAIPSNATCGIEIVFSVDNLTSGLWQITNCQFEIGATATTFENRLYETELSLCQRRCWKWNSAMGLSGPIGVGVAVSSTSASVFIQLPFQMFSVPSITLSAATTFAFGSNSVTAVVASYSSDFAIKLTLTTTGLTTGQAGIASANATTNTYVLASAEL